MRVLVQRALFAASAFAAIVAGGTRVEAAGATDVGGDWLFKISGHKGLVSLHFQSPEFDVFQAQGAGFTTLFPTQPFAVEEVVEQTLSFDSTGSIHGTIALQDVTRTTTIGSLVITSGRANTALTHCLLKGTLSIGESAPKAVVLTGEPLLSPASPGTGRDFNGRLAGRGVKSSKFDVQLYDATTAPQGGPATPGYGFPFYVLVAGGACRVDGVESPTSRMQGLLMSDMNGVIFGRVDSSDFGPGVVGGKLGESAGVAGGLPVLHLVFKSDAGRVVNLNATLTPN